MNQKLSTTKIHEQEVAVCIKHNAYDKQRMQELQIRNPWLLAKYIKDP